MYTQLMKGSGELVWYPNTQLQQTAIINVSRSGPRWEGHTWLLDMDTPDEVRRQADGCKQVGLPPADALTHCMRQVAADASKGMGQH
jgi:small-conductance mechanosensitive channel